ncbi:NAD(P)-binding protein [Exidia glandulosa HHB12029]|uniref:NAD(P)-binding protein n=1 Tax=Exidia glandulosa HHB12029 TaxID=1314781 RepID=A0A165Q090_EXIGL|nr:NAD(P)-binding protein [Exidia glandulosa HHB12029]
MPAFSAVLAANKQNAPKAIRPVAVLVGGTSGCGRGVAEVLAKYTEGNAHIVLVGRSEEAANEIIASLPKPVDGAKYEFVKCDVSSMRNVGIVSRDLASRLDKINYLVLSPGILSLAGRRPTEDGVDYKARVAIHYYSRFKFARDLAPLLEKASAAGEPARVLTILDSWMGGPSGVRPDDMKLEKDYSVRNAALVATTYNDGAVAALAKRYPTVSFIHGHPGVVNTNINRDLPFGIKQLTGLLGSLISTSVTTCGENMVYSLFDPKIPTGAHYRTSKGDAQTSKPNLSNADVEKIWQHSTEICDGK